MIVPPRWLSVALLLAAPLVAWPSLGAPPRRAPPRPSHRASVTRWHTPTPGQQAPTDEHGRAQLVLTSLNTTETVTLPALTDEGGFDAASLDAATRLLRDSRTGLQHPVEPSLLDLVYQAQRRFQAHEIRVVSSYRAPRPSKPPPPRPGRPPSPPKPPGIHAQGRAIDFVVPGATDKDVAAWARTLGFVGVGIYPNSGYVHLDVRPQSYFWTDPSGPGQRNREIALAREPARQADDEAWRRGRRPVLPYRWPASTLDGAWRASPAETTTHEPEPAHDD